MATFALPLGLAFPASCCVVPSCVSSVPHFSDCFRWSLGKDSRRLIFTPSAVHSGPMNSARITLGLLRLIALPAIPFNTTINVTTVSTF